MKRLFDIIFSLSLLILFSPLLILLALLVGLESKGGVFYKQQRVGLNNKDFYILKFRSMKVGSDKKGELTLGNSDDRITKSGKFIRKYKFDELPQLFNILKGEMTLVGPRPEVRRYVALYNKEQLKVLTVKPGLVDYSSLKFSDESSLLEKQKDPEKFYIEQLMPEKLNLSLQYIKEQSFLLDLKIIFKTIKKIWL